MTASASPQFLTGLPPVACSAEGDEFERRKRAALEALQRAERPDVFDDSHLIRQGAKDPTEEFAPWTIQHAKIPESPSPLPMMVVLLALWAMAFYAFAYWLSGPH